MRVFIPIPRVLLLCLAWIALTTGCSPATSGDVRASLERAKVTDAKKRGDTELHIAAARSDFSELSKLIARGADLNALNDQGQTPLMLAIRQEQTSNARILIEKGAAVNVVDEEGNAALHLAIQVGQVDTAKLLLAHGATLNIPNKVKDTPLLLATRLDYPELTRLFLDKSARLDIVDTYGLTPLHYTASWKRTALSLELVDRGISPDVKAKNGQTPLMVAAYYGEDQTVARLLKKGVKVDLKDNEGRTSLHLGGQSGYRNVAAVLLDHGADINAATPAGQTAILLAAQNDHADVVAFLASCGAKFFPLSGSHSAKFASALVAQAISDHAQKRHDISKASEHARLAGEWFDKAAEGYQDDADLAAAKIMAREVLKTTTYRVFIPVMYLPGIFPFGIPYRAEQLGSLRQLQALGDAAAAGIGPWGKFSLVEQYGRAFQSLPVSSIRMVGQLLPEQVLQENPDLGELKELYGKLAQRARDASKSSRAKEDCLNRTATISDTEKC